MLPGPRSPVEQARLMKLMARFPAAGLMQLYQRYGPVSQVGVRPFRYVAMLGPEANRLLFSERFDSFRWREAMQVLVPIDGETAMVVSDGEEHRRRRSAAQAAFATKRIHGYLDVMVEEFRRELRQWPDGGRIDALASIRRPIKRLTVRCLFGDLDDTDELIDALDVTIDFVNLPMWRQYKLDLPGTRWRRAKLARARSDAIVNAEIASRRAHAGQTGATDVLDILLSARGDDGAPALSDVEVRDQVVSLIAASYDTVRSTGAWALHELMANPSVWAAAAEEVRSVVGDDELRVEHLGQLRYLDWVINETLRMWPSTAVSARYVVEPVELAGVTVPAGSNVLWSSYVTHRLPEHWPEPDRFRPERWGEGEPAPYTFVPFGGGYRQCLGFAFARQQLKVLLVEVLRSLELAPDYAALTPVGLPALHPREGLPVRVARKAALPG